MPAAPRVHLHVGLQKTGTSYLQGVLTANADRLAAQGLALLPASRREAFELMLQVRERYNPRRDPASVAGALERFAAALAASQDPAVLVSQESLAASRPRQVRRLVEACGGREVHVVLTVRDVARQLPSAWQQELKAGKTVGYREFLRTLVDAHGAGSTSHPWIQLDAAAVLRRWAEAVPPERIHVVTVPPPGSPTTLLLERFCRAVGLDPADLRPEQRASNTSLGRAQAELLRRVNAALPDDLRRRQVYGDLGKRFFASGVLASQQGRRITVPADLRAWCEEVAEEQVTALAAAGYRVEGDLADLRCRDDGFAPDGHATEPTEDEVSEAAVASLATVLERRARTAGGRRRGRSEPGPVRRGRRLLRRLLGRT